MQIFEKIFYAGCQPGSVDYTISRADVFLQENCGQGAALQKILYSRTGMNYNIYRTYVLKLRFEICNFIFYNLII